MRWEETNSCFSRRPSAATVAIRKKGAHPGTYQYPDFLMHYGIKGQKWYVRRYQNEDGTLTEEGKLRYNEGEPESESWNKSEAKYLTDKELQRRNNRLNQERMYKEALTSEAERNAKQVKSDIIKKVIAGTAISLAAVAMRGHWKQAASLVGKYGKQAVSKLRSPVIRKMSQRNTMQSVGSRFANAANKYTRPPAFHPHREWGPLSVSEIVNKRRPRALW